MLNPSIRFCPSWLLIINRLSRRTLTGLLLTFGLVVGGVSAVPAQSTESSAAINSTGSLGEIQSLSANSSTALPDGTYLYGQAPDPNQIGSAYLVFEVNGDRVLGAFYMPYSSFDCFQGRFEGNQLALTITNSYEQTTHPYSIAVSSPSNVATADNPAIAPLELEGYHHLSDISENDERILATCQAQYN